MLARFSMIKPICLARQPSQVIAALELSQGGIPIDKGGVSAGGGGGKFARALGMIHFPPSDTHQKISKENFQSLITCFQPNAIDLQSPHS